MKENYKLELKAFSAFYISRPRMRISGHSVERKRQQFRDAPLSGRNRNVRMSARIRSLRTASQKLYGKRDLDSDRTGMP